jgi:hypothetical protein
MATAAKFTAEADNSKVPALDYRWDFDDGIAAEGASVFHAFTHSGSHSVRLHVDGLDDLAYEKLYQLAVGGETDTHFSPQRNQRYEPENPNHQP